MKIKVFISAIFFLLVTSAYGYDQWVGTEYQIDQPSITLAWDASVGATKYEAIAVWIDPTPDFIYPLEETTELQKVVQRIRTGHFIFKVRACNSVGCSDEWADASVPEFGIVNGIPEGWRIYWKMPAPTGPVVE